MKRTIYTLNVNDYAPEIRELTYPLLKRYAHKIGAEFVEITTPYDLGAGGEGCNISGKFHLSKLASDNPGWTIYLDADALVHPDAFDYSACLDFEDKFRRPSVFSFGRDFAYERFRAEDLRRWFQEDLPNDMPQTATEGLGLCTWFVICCTGSHMVWEPPDSLDVVNHIHPTVSEAHIKTPLSLLDDYQTSVNAARYNLSVTFAEDIHNICPGTVQRKMAFWHTHLLSIEQKVRQMRWMIRDVWRLEDKPCVTFGRLEREWIQQVKGRKARKP